MHKSKWNHQCVHKTCLMMMGCVEENDTKTACPPHLDDRLLDDETVCPRSCSSRARYEHERKILEQLSCKHAEAEHTRGTPK